MSSKPKTLATKVPKLRFPGFREAEGWKTEMLGRLCKIRTGKKDANEGAADGAYPFFTCAENHIYSHSYSFDAEAILIAGNANVGQTKYYNGKFEAYQRTYVLTDFTGISVSYLYAILNAKLRESLLEQVQVSAMSYIKLPMLQEYGLAVPPTPAEQQKIAECLSSVDELMAAQARKVDALKTHKKGLMQQLFPREGETAPRLRFPEFRDAGEWKSDSLGNIFETSSGGTPSRTEKAYWNGDIPWITTSLVDFRVITSAEEFLTAEGLKNSSAKLFPKGTVLMAMYGQGKTRGQVALLGIKAATNQACAAILPRKGIDPYFVFLNLAGRYEEIREISNSGGQENLSQGLIREIRFAFPLDDDEQRKVTACLSSLDALIAAEIRKLEALKIHKKGLMQQLFPSLEEGTA